MSTVDESFRNEFILPTNKAVGAIHVEDQDSPCIYLCGNSLGALPKQSQKFVQEEFEVWGTRAVEGHFNHPLGREWATITDHVHPLFAEIVGWCTVLLSIPRFLNAMPRREGDGSLLHGDLNKQSTLDDASVL